MVERMTRIHKTSDDRVLILADKLGYKVELNKTSIYLVKDGIKLYRKSYTKAYEYLYYKNKKKSA